MGKWKRIKVGFSDGSGNVTDNDGAWLTTADKAHDSIVTGGHDDWGCKSGVLNSDNADRLVSCWNACRNLEKPEQDIPKLIEALKTITSYDLGDFPSSVVNLLYEALALVKE